MGFAQRWRAPAAALGLFVSLMLVPTEVPRLGFFTSARYLMGEAALNDFAADWVGARLVLEGEDPYPVLTDAFAAEGIVFEAEFRNPHPPTAFVLALPLSQVSFRVATAIWAWLQLGLLVAAAVLLGVRPLTAVAGIPLLLSWPPATTSLSQTTALWLFCGAAAWKLSRRGKPGWAGAVVGLASLPKGYAGLLVAPLIEHGRWRTVYGFSAVIAAAVGVVVVLDPGLFARWLEVGQGELPVQLVRDNINGAPMAMGYRAAGWAGLGTALVVCLGVAAAAALRGRRWQAAAWLSVAALPAAWVYAVVPLVLAVRSRYAMAVLVVGPFVTLPFRPPVAWVVFLAIAVAGVDLLRPGRLDFEVCPESEDMCLGHDTEAGQTPYVAER